MNPFTASGVALVTGAANGIGRASALALAAAGADLALFDLEEAPLEAVAEAVRASGRRALPLVVDCTDAPAVEAAVAQVERDLGAVETLFNNVGQSARDKAGPFLESEEATWRFVVEVSLLTTLRHQPPGRTRHGGARPRPDRQHVDRIGLLW